MINDYQRGVSLYFVIVILSILMAVVLGLTTITISQLKITSALSQTVIAFYAADTGIEEMLQDMQNPNPFYSGYLDLNGNEQPDEDSDAFYQVTVTASGAGECAATTYCVASAGRFRQTKRAIEITY